MSSTKPKATPSVKPEGPAVPVAAKPETKPENPKPQKMAGPVRKTPGQWFIASVQGKRSIDAMHMGAAYGAAVTMHGWREHAYHAGREIRLTEQDYQAALKAAGAGTASHAPALSPHKGKRI